MQQAGHTYSRCCRALFRVRLDVQFSASAFVTLFFEKSLRIPANIIEQRLMTLIPWLRHVFRVIAFTSCCRLLSGYSLELFEWLEGKTRKQCLHWERIRYRTGRVNTKPCAQNQRYLLRRRTELKSLQAFSPPDVASAAMFFPSSWLLTIYQTNLATPGEKSRTESANSVKRVRHWPSTCNFSKNCLEKTIY